MTFPIEAGDVVKSKLSHGKYVREATILNVDAAGMVLYNIREHWGKSSAGKVTKWLYRHIDKFEADYHVTLN